MPCFNEYDKQNSTPDDVVDYYLPQILSANDYYPFGMGMPGRKYSEGNYRYGFNGKEKDNDINSLTAYDYGFRIYNPAIGRFLSEDPLTKEYPWYTPYQFAGNKPIIAKDLDGLEEVEVQIVAKEYYDPVLQNQAKALAGVDKQAVIAMQRTAWNQVISDLDAIVAKHFDPKHNTSLTTSQWSGITSDVASYLAGSNGSLKIWNSYANYDYDYATTDEISSIIDGTVNKLVQNHFYASTSGTEFYYRYINSVNEAKDPNKKAALIAERERVSKQRWSAILNGAALGFAEAFMAATGMTGAGSGTIGGRTFRTGYYASEGEYVLLKLENGGYAPIYRSGPRGEEGIFQLKPNEFKPGTPGSKYPARGLSLNMSIDEAQTIGSGVYRIKSIPSELRLLKTPSTRFRGHVDIIPKDINMTKARFQELLNQIQYERINF